MMRLQSKTIQFWLRVTAGLGSVVGASLVMAGPSPRLTPKPQSLRSYPAPAVPVPSQAGVLGPYGVGLAAAAPVGTPYLRSPAFAGPSIIYMPQSVTRVLVPGTTPHPSNLMQPTDRYIYSSAPFTRTDVFVNLPYGGFYRPQGFAGTTPVEPQIPAYIPQPVSAVLTAEAGFTAGNFVTEGRDDFQMVPQTTGDLSVAPAPGVAPPGGITPMGLPSADSPGVAPILPSTTPAPAPVFTPAPIVSTPAPVVSTPAPVSTPAITTSLPSLAEAAAGSGVEIIVDDNTPGATRQDPPGSWTPSVNVADSWQGSSIIARADGTARSVTFLADIPSDGKYEVFVWYTVSGETLRSRVVPVIVNTANGEQRATVDQVEPTLRRTWVPVGTFDLRAGQAQPVVTISTEGLPSEGTIFVSADAIRLVKVQ